MLNKFIVASLFIASIAVYTPVYASDNSCKVEVAVSTPPIQLDQSVAFNVTTYGNQGSSKAITVKGGSAPQVINQLTCGMAYNISATAYSTPSNGLRETPPIGQCMLKTGVVVLQEPGSSVSVVFPNDFICSQTA